jgi:serine/threonine protein kinase
MQDDGSSILTSSFLYEITIMNALPRCDYIVDFIGYSEKPKAILMKFYPTNLGSVLKEPSYKSVLEKECLMALDIAMGMELIHSRGIIHFDLKPGNVLVYTKDDQYRCAICDFGFANFSADAKTNIVKGLKKPTNTGITPRYAAPELFEGLLLQAVGRRETEIDKAIDVFAYAMTVFFIFTKEKPWGDAMGFDEIEQRIVKGERPVIPKEIDPRIQEIIQVNWRHNPEERKSFCEIVKTLRRLILE